MTRVAPLAVLLACSIVLVRGQAPASGQMPTFRSGIDVIEIDATVLDKDHQPVRGLAASDFTILDRGKPQEIVAFAAVDVPGPSLRSAAWMRDAPLDVVSNDVTNRRLVTIIMDDAYSRLEPGVVRTAKQIARNAIDQLGPADLASIVFTFIGRPQNFTADRSQLIAAVESFVPRTIGGEPPVVCQPRHRSCDVETLATVASTLLTAPAGRKVVVVISGGRSFTFGAAGDPSSRNEAPELLQTFRNLQRANATIYAFTSHGLQVDRPDDDSLYSFAASTGGRAFANTNAPEAHVADAFRESSVYYLLGFKNASASGDTGFRKIDVKVNRPGVEVRTRNGYFPPKPTEARREEIINGLPGGDLPVHVTSVVFAVPGRQEAEVIAAIRLPTDTVVGPGTVQLTTTAVDMDGKVRGAHRQTVDIRRRELSPDLTSHLPLRPGRYMLNVAAESDGHTGTVTVDTEVPDFSRERLALSGLVLQQEPAHPPADKALVELVPAMPTARRQFAPMDKVSAFLRVYQGGKDRIVPAMMTARIVNDRNVAVSNQEAELETRLFDASRAADYRIGVPIAHLVPGEYLLTIEAVIGSRRAKRTARFTMTQEP